MPTISPARWESLTNRQHFALAVVLTWLILTSPWVAMFRRIPLGAGFLDYAHVVVGFVALLLGITYTLTCLRGDRWLLYFPLAAGRVATIAGDVASLLRGKIPPAEGGGLFAAIEGLLLLAVLVTGLTGAGWFFVHGSPAALAWRSCHVVAAHWLIGLFVVHLLAVSLHVLDFVRER